MAIKLNIPLPSKGLVVDRPAEFVDQRAVYATKNMEHYRALIRKRKGTTSIGSSLGERVQRYFELQIGTESRLFRVGLTKVEVLNKSTNVWSSVASSALTGAVTDQVAYAFPLLSGTKVAVFSNGLDAIRRCAISGSDATLGGSPPKAKYLLAHGSYLLLANVVDGGTQYGSRVQWCDTGAIETWTGGNAGSKNLIDDPEDISGLGAFRNFVTVHKPKSIYLGQLVTTSEVFRFDRQATGIGAVAGATIQNIPSGEQIFLAADGIRLFNGVTAPLIPSPIQDEIREEMNPIYSYKAQAIYVEELDEYWVCLPLGSDTEPQTVYKYNWRTGQIYKDSRANLTALGLFLNTAQDTWNDRSGTWDADTTTWNSITNQSNSPVVIFGDSSGTSTKRSAAVNNDNGTAIDGQQDTKDFTAEDLGDPDQDRMVRWSGMELWALGNSVKVYYSTDEGSTWTLASTVTLSSTYPSDGSPLNVWFDVVSSRIRFRFLNDTAGESFTLKKYQIEGKIREARK